MHYQWGCPKQHSAGLQAAAGHLQELLGDEALAATFPAQQSLMHLMQAAPPDAHATTMVRGFCFMLCYDIPSSCKADRRENSRTNRVYLAKKEALLSERCDPGCNRACNTLQRCWLSPRTESPYWGA